MWAGWIVVQLALGAYLLTWSLQVVFSSSEIFAGWMRVGLDLEMCLVRELGLKLKICFWNSCVLFVCVCVCVCIYIHA